MAEYAYVRVSSKDQNVHRQLDAMAAVAIPPERIYIDKMSGKDFDRPMYRALMEVLREGDTICIKSIDRLGRNYQEIIEKWRIITKEKKVHIRVLDMPLLNTGGARNGTKDGTSSNLTDIFIADLVLQILSYVARRWSA